jgi:hypothetical protein
MKGTTSRTEAHHQAVAGRDTGEEPTMTVARNDPPVGDDGRVESSSTAIVHQEDKTMTTDSGALGQEGHEPAKKATPGNGEYPKELPEPPAPDVARPAATADKLKKFAEARTDPKTGLVQVRKRLISLPVRKGPHQDWFVRTSKRPQHHGILPLFWDKGGDDEASLVDDAVRDYFAGRVQRNYGVLTITRTKTLFLWCNPLENDKGEWNSWHRSAHDHKLLAADAWIRVIPNKELGGYEPGDPCGGPYSEPEFPEDLTWERIVELAFRRHYIDSAEHPIIRRLLGYEN